MIKYTQLIKDIAEANDKKYREIEALWERFHKETEIDKLKDPLKYAHLKKSDGSLGEEIKRRLDYYLKNEIEQEKNNEFDEFSLDDIGDEFDYLTDDVVLDEPTDDITGIEGEGENFDSPAEDVLDIPDDEFDFT